MWSPAIAMFASIVTQLVSFASLSNFLEEVGIELSGLLMTPNASRDYHKLTRTVGDYVGILDI